MHRTPLVFCALAPSLLTTVALAQTWQAVPTTSHPTGRYFAAMAYMIAQDQVVLFGGLNSGVARDDTWTYANGSWSIEQPTVSPPPRVAAAVAYDAARDRVVVFGGQQYPNQMFADTWEWDGTQWSEATPSTAPPARRGAQMVFDPTRGACVLHGGESLASGSAAPLDDMWAWNGSTWQPIAATNAPQRVDHAMVFDAARGRYLLFGGSDGSAELAETWLFDPANDTWTPAAASGPSPSAGRGHGMVFDTARDRVVLQGGRSGFFPLDETWEWDGSFWYRVTGGASLDRSYHSMVYHVSRGSTFAFGGWATGSTTVSGAWEYFAAEVAPFGAGCPGSAGVPTLAAAGVPSLGGSYVVEVSTLPPTGGAAFLVLGFSSTSWNGVPLPFPLGTLGLPGCTGHVSVDDALLLTHAAGSVTRTIAVPSTASLRDLEFFFQALSVDPAAANPAGAAASNALRHTIR